MARQRLDEVLVEQGLFRDVRLALGPIMAGDVVVDGNVVTKPGLQVRPDADIHLRGAAIRFASRGGYKLERALKAFGISVDGLSVLDIGASTGGFTDCLLQHGAAKVYAVDVGFGQLRGALAADDRVAVFEKTNISDLKPEMISGRLDMVTVDLSYLSLQKALPILRDQLPPWSEAVCLVKPLYEGLAQDNPADIAGIAVVLQKLLDQLAALGFAVRDICASPILGGRGAVEFLIYVLPFDGVVNESQTLVATAIRSFQADPPKKPEEIA